jgi:hypothetical protein
MPQELKTLDGDTKQIWREAVTMLAAAHGEDFPGCRYHNDDNVTQCPFEVRAKK